MREVSRLTTRSRVVARAVATRLAHPLRRIRPAPPERILVAHHLLLGDTLMCTALLAKLREQHRAARIDMTVAPAMLPLYHGRPFGVLPLAFDPRQSETLDRLFAHGEGGYDLALVPGDNRFAWLAAALGARHIVAHAGDRPARKSWMVDELRPYPLTPRAVSDLFAELCDGAPPNPYRQGQWSPPPRPDGTRLPVGRYAVLHVGASTRLKRWPDAQWRALARTLAGRGMTPVWSGGAAERDWVERIDPQAAYANLAGQYDLAGLWHLLAGAELLVCPDTGVAHLGRVVGVPTVALFGPGSATVSGAGDYWRLAPFRTVTVPDFPCRDQTILFRREVAWVQRCGRTPGTGRGHCEEARCMQAIELAPVLAAVDQVLKLARG